MVGGPRIELAEGRNNLRYLENLVGVPIRDLQGARDDPVLVSGLRLAFRRLAGWKAADAELLEFPELAHDVDRQAVDWTAFFPRSVRDPRPRRVVRCAARPGEGRSSWVEILATSSRVEETFVPRVNPATWKALSPEAQREKLEAMADERTARIEVVRESPGELVVQQKDVERFRLLFTRDDLPEKRPIRMRLGSRSRTLTVTPAASVLLSEFVERFDRTFLPVGEALLP